MSLGFQRYIGHVLDRVLNFNVFSTGTIYKHLNCLIWFFPSQTLLRG